MTDREKRHVACGFVPYPGSGAYGHWTCSRRRRHLGAHRFNNYIIGRVPHFWRLVRLASARSTRLPKWQQEQLARKVLYPAKYRPVP